MSDGPKTQVSVNKEDALTFYRQMLAIRRLEAASGAMYKEKAIRGFCHLYSGQEACAVGMKAALRTGDDVITAYRCHGWTYLMGASISSVLCELTGNVEGVSRGKGGSMVRSLHFQLNETNKFILNYLLALIRTKLLRRKWNCWSSSSIRSWFSFCSPVQRNWWCLHCTLW